MKKEINIQIGERVHSAREKAHMSREQLAEELNISSLFLGYIECGQKGMSLTTLKNLCTILGVSSDYILLGIDDTDINKKNIQILIDSIDSKYLPILEKNIKNLICSIKEIEQINSKDTLSSEQPLSDDTF